MIAVSGSRMLLVVLALTASAAAQAEQFLLVVRITDTEWTEYSDPYECPEGGQCITHNFWNIHTADVKKRIAGDYPEDTIRFVRLQHAQYVDHIREHLYVLIQETDDETFEELFGTRLIARETAFVQTLVCFRADLGEVFPDMERFDYDEGELRSETCFDQSMIEDGPDGDGSE